MRVRWIAASLLAAPLGAAILSAQGRSTLFLAPKTATPAGWVAPNKPWTRLPDVLAKHTGAADWSEAIVSDDLLQAS